MLEGNRGTPKRFLPFLETEEYEALIFHLLFATLCVITLVLPISLSIGIKMSFLVLLYITTLPLFGYFRNYSDWIAIWIFALSQCQQVCQRHLLGYDVNIIEILTAAPADQRIQLHKPYVNQRANCHTLNATGLIEL